MSAPGVEPIPADLIDRMAARVRSNLEAIPKTAQPTISYDSLHEAAAVLAWFDPGSLRGSDGTADPAATEGLLTDCQPVMAADGTRRWALSTRVRVAALRQLRERDRVQAALAANPVRPPDSLQQALEAYLGGGAAPVEQQPLATLSASYQACEWLRDAGFSSVPGRDRIQRRLDWLTLLQPLEHITGEHFRGRTRELAQLRRYVDVLRSESAPEAIGRWWERNVVRRDRPPLLVYGPGGVGKSALLARFILDHAQARDTVRYPFIYLDFDRPDVDASEPLTLLVEAVRQLGIEYPQAHERCERIRADWLGRLARDAAAGPAKSSPETARFRPAAVRDFGNLIDSLGGNDQPALFVLDTFEEVQWRSDVYVAAIWQLLEQLQEVIDRLRVCVSGRAQIAGHETEDLALAGLDEEASIGYLQARGVTDPVVARTLASQMGGNPLSLKLAAELYEREGLTGGKLDIETRGFFLRRAEDARIQRQLYHRILGHIHDPKVRQLAHPGLVLRRITPELIRHVLTGPCHLDIRTDTEARALFGKLRREVALVTAVSDDALEHRRDLRRLMLGFLEEDDPLIVHAIHEFAVTWYESRPSWPEDRAEEIYHRLALGQDPEVIDGRWLPGVEPYLMSALPEFHGSRLAYLSLRLNLEVSAETRQLAEVEDWERIVERKARDLLAQGQPEEVLSLLASRGDRTGASPLFRLEATALAQLGRWADSFEVLDRGIESALAATARQQVLDLVLQQTEVTLAWASVAPPEQVSGRVPARRLDRLSEGSLPPADRLNVVAHRLALARESSTPRPEIAELEDELRKAFDAVPDDVLNQDPAPARWAASVWQDAGDAGQLARVLRVCGWPRADEAALRQAGAAIAPVDLRLSADAGERPGMLAREFGIPERDSLTETWSDFLLTEGGSTVGDVLVRLLGESTAAVPGELVTALATVMRAALGAWMRAPEAPSPAAQKRPHRRLSKQVREDLAAALVSAFPSYDKMRVLLGQGLDQSLDSIVHPGLPPRSAALLVVETAYDQGWLDLLITRAGEAAPASVPLAQAAGQLGLSGLVPGGSGAETATRDLARGTDLRAGQLAAIARQVCRVEMDSQLRATGCLVGADLVLTADHVLGPLWDGSVSPSAVTVRFDLTTGPREQIVTEGATFRLGEVVHHSATLDYALLRVHGSPGVQPIGGPTGPGGTLRRWIDLSDPPDIRLGSPAVMVSYPRALATAVAGQGEVISLSDDSVGYTINSQPGSSGAPCFTQDLRLVALYTRSEPGRSAIVAVPVSAVLRDLRDMGFGHLLGTPLA